MDVLIYGVPAVVLIGILVQAIKKAGVPTSWIPLLSLILGVLVVVVGSWVTGVTLGWEGVVYGIIAGATTSGLYDNASKVRGMIK